ncbi:adenosine kinase-like protein, partial [Euroglyphus maynei]
CHKKKGVCLLICIELNFILFYDHRSVLGLGNPLLDVIATCDEEFLKKYDLEANNAILAEAKHEKLCADLTEKFKVQYLAGGSVQNSMRVAQWFMQRSNVCTFFGCVGQDDFARQMKNKAEEDRLNAVYMVDPETPTGTCACMITQNGKCRSLCAYLGASQKFSIEHVKKNFEYVESARIFYVSGFHLIISLEPTLLLAKHAHEFEHKLFVINLSAPYISQFYSDKLLQVLPYVDLLFGNETEADAFAKIQKWDVSEF